MKFHLSTSIISYIIVALVSALLLAATFRGTADIRHYSSILDTRVGGPFESSNNNARYALTKSILENGSFYFTQELAHFSAPDLVYYDGNFTSIFTPGVSLAAIPLYAIGQIFDMEQVFAYLLNPLFALIAVLLIAKMTNRFTGSVIASSIAALSFLLATNALVYSQTLTQHLISTCIILWALSLTTSKHHAKKYLYAGVLLGSGVLVDLPNAISLIPALLVVVSDSVGVVVSKLKTKLTIDTLIGLLFVGMLPFVGFFGYYNKATNASPVKIAQFIGRTEKVTPEVSTVIPDETVEPDDSSFEFPFYSRISLDGLYILLISNERGIFYYSPILLLGILGAYVLYKDRRNERAAVVGITTALLIVVMYSMFGDPWGGWSFGPRYLIPVSAILSIFLGVAVDRYKKNILFSAVFFGLLAFSVYVTMLGAITTAAVPPRGEALSLPDPVPYTYHYNIDRIEQNLSSSYVYNSLARDRMSLADYSYYLMGIEMSVFIALYSVLLYRPRRSRS